MTAEIDLVPLDLSPDGLTALAGLFKIVWPQAAHLTPEYLDWAYNRNPDGAAIGYNAVSEGRVVGHYAVQPLRSMFDGIEARGVLSLNTAVHPSFRGKGFFQKLARATYGRASDEGRWFVVGVANAMSAPLFWKVFKFQAVGPMEVWAGLGTPPVDPNREPEVRFERIWSTGSIAWRLGQPGNHYRGTRSGADTIIFCPAGPLGIHADLGRVKTASMNQPLPPVRTMSPLRVWAGLDPRRVFRPLGRVPIPVKWRPSPLHVIFKDLKDAGRSLDRRHTLFSLIDFDAY
jgi:GNAT superfamily N-acetyltransferase